MSLGLIEYYFLGINIFGFVLAIISTLLYCYTANGQIDIILTIVATICGSLGIVLEFLLIDRLLAKCVMLSRVYAVCMGVIQLIIFLWLEGFHAQEINFAIVDFFEKNKILLMYLLVINGVAFLFYGLDKWLAIEHKSRIRIVTLLLVALLGGSIGALIAMYVFRHKTRKIYFTIGVPLILIMQIIVIFYAMNLA